MKELNFTDKELYIIAQGVAMPVFYDGSRSCVL